MNVGAVMFFFTINTLGSHPFGDPRSLAFISSFATIIENRLCKINDVGLGCLTSVEC